MTTNKIKKILAAHVEEFSIADSKIKNSPDWHMVQAAKEIYNKAVDETVDKIVSIQSDLYNITTNFIVSLKV